MDWDGWTAAMDDTDVNTTQHSTTLALSPRANSFFDLFEFFDLFDFGCFSELLMVLVALGLVSDPEG